MDASVSCPQMAPQLPLTVPAMKVHHLVFGRGQHILLLLPARLIARSEHTTSLKCLHEAVPQRETYSHAEALAWDSSLSRKGHRWCPSETKRHRSDSQPSVPLCSKGRLSSHHKGGQVRDYKLSGCGRPGLLPALLSQLASSRKAQWMTAASFTHTATSTGTQSHQWTLPGLLRRPSCGPTCHPPLLRTGPLTPSPQPRSGGGRCP